MGQFSLSKTSDVTYINVSAHSLKTDMRKLIILFLITNVCYGQLPDPTKYNLPPLLVLRGGLGEVTPTGLRPRYQDSWNGWIIYKTVATCIMTRGPFTPVHTSQRDNYPCSTEWYTYVVVKPFRREWFILKLLNLTYVSDKGLYQY